MFDSIVCRVAASRQYAVNQLRASAACSIRTHSSVPYVLCVGNLPDNKAPLCSLCCCCLFLFLLLSLCVCVLSQLLSRMLLPCGRNYELSTLFPTLPFPPLSLSLSLPPSHARNHARNHQRSNINGTNNMHYIAYISDYNCLLAPADDCPKGQAGRMIDMPRRMRNPRAKRVLHLISQRGVYAMCVLVYVVSECVCVCWQFA